MYANPPAQIMGWKPLDWVAWGRLGTVNPCRAAVALTSVVALALAGCASPKPQPSAPRTTNKPASSPAGRPSPGPPVAMGEKTTLGGTVEATTLSYRQPSVTGGPPAGPAGYTWGSADVQVCTLASAKSRVNVNWKTWSLRYADNSIVPASDKNDNAFPRPQYPFADHVVAPGQCVRGWITFAVPADQQPVAVEYAPQGFLGTW
jgi:hypothetical protein